MRVGNFLDEMTNIILGKGNFLDDEMMNYIQGNIFTFLYSLYRDRRFK